MLFYDDFTHNKNILFTNLIVIYHLMTLMTIELVSKELNHLAAILHDYARVLNFMK